MGEPGHSKHPKDGLQPGERLQCHQPIVSSHASISAKLQKGLLHDQKDLLGIYQAAEGVGERALELVEVQKGVPRH